ncbi:hypothetical protein EGQ24_07410 [bacterium]|nr:hypothetical protein [bacterium]
MGNQFGYKKYMKKEAQKDNSLLKIFVLSFFGMLIVFTFLIKSFSPTVDTSIGDYQDNSQQEETAKNVDDRLSMIQSEDQGRSFSDLMSKPDDVPQKADNQTDVVVDQSKTVKENNVAETVTPQPVQADPVYKVFVGSYTSAEQAKVAKDIIQESGNGLNPIVKCIGSNNYTLQVGIFKNKQSAESLLYTVQQNHLPGRIVQDY